MLTHLGTMSSENLLIYFLFTACFFNNLILGQYYINNGVFKFVTGIDFPLDVKVSGGSFGWFTNLEVAYDLPNNITYYEPYKIMQKRSIKNTFNRYFVYQGLQKYFDRLGISGKDCIYRMICEVTRRKVNRHGNGLLGEIIQILFSPETDVHPGLEKHKYASQEGSTNETDCGTLFNDCLLQENSFILRL